MGWQFGILLVLVIAFFSKDLWHGLRRFLMVALTRHHFFEILSLFQASLTVMNRVGPTRFQVDKSIQMKRRFVLFIKILMKNLQHTGDTETLAKARFIVFDCTRRNRLGDPKYSPLMDAICRRLRTELGEWHWYQAHLCMLHLERRIQLQLFGSRLYLWRRFEHNTVQFHCLC